MYTKDILYETFPVAGHLLLLNLHSCLSTFIKPPYTTDHRECNYSPTVGGMDGSLMSGLQDLDITALEGKINGQIELW